MKLKIKQSSLELPSPSKKKKKLKREVDDAESSSDESDEATRQRRRERELKRREKKAKRKAQRRKEAESGGGDNDSDTDGDTKKKKKDSTMKRKKKRKDESGNPKKRIRKDSSSGGKMKLKIGLKGKDLGAVTTNTAHVAAESGSSSVHQAASAPINTKANTSEPLYCVCKQPQNDSMLYLGCEGGCDGWFHPECIGFERCNRIDHNDRALERECIKLLGHAHTETTQGVFVCPSCTRTGYAEWTDERSREVTKVADREDHLSFYFDRLLRKQLMKDDLRKRGLDDSAVVTPPASDVEESSDDSDSEEEEELFGIEGEDKKKKKKKKKNDKEKTKKKKIMKEKTTVKELKKATKKLKKSNSAAAAGSMNRIGTTALATSLPAQASVVVKPDIPSSVKRSGTKLSTSPAESPRAKTKRRGHAELSKAEQARVKEEQKQKDLARAGWNTLRPNELAEHQYCIDVELARLSEDKRTNVDGKSPVMFVHKSLSPTDKEVNLAKARADPWLTLVGRTILPVSSTTEPTNEKNNNSSNNDNDNSKGIVNDVLSDEKFAALWKAAQARRQVQLVREQLRIEKLNKKEAAQKEENERFRLRIAEQQLEKERKAQEEADHKRALEKQREEDHKRLRAEERAKRERMGKANHTVDQSQIMSGRAAPIGTGVLSGTTIGSGFGGSTPLSSTVRGTPVVAAAALDEEADDEEDEWGLI